MKSIAFTIVAKNYIGLAKILRKSFVHHNPEVDFQIIVADEYEEQDDVIVANKVVNISAEKWREMSFKYDITEFCTAIKPFSFDYFFNAEGYEKVIYLDPDIFLFGSFADIFETLDSYSFYLIPHLTLPDDSYEGERVYLQSGIYNLGFIGMRKSSNSQRFVTWWEHKLYDYCFDDLISYTFTDQKWANYIPSFYPHDVFISTHLGMNVAPWNYHERTFYKEEGKIFVKSRLDSDGIAAPLLFVHYSGFNYKGLLTGSVVRNRRGGYEQYDDLHVIICEYEQALKSYSDLFLQYIDLPYSYGAFSNGAKIDKFHRRLYRKLVQNGKDIGNPFDSNNELFFVKISKLGMITKETVNRMDIEDVGGIGGKIRILCSLMKIVYKVVGYKRYIQLLKFMKYFSRSESQAFLLDKEMMNYILSV